MTDPKSPKSPSEADRAARQAAALRENLKRRKQQARERAAQDDGMSDIHARGAALRDFWFVVHAGHV